MITGTLSKNLSYFCKICYDTRYIVNLNITGKIVIQLCDQCISDDLSQEIIKDAFTKCDLINKQNIDPDDNSQIETFIEIIKNKREYINILKSFELFISNYPEIKRKRKHLEILKNPNNFRIVRPIDPPRFTALHLFTRNQVFQIISDENRSKYTERSHINGDILDIPFNREFIGWGGNIFFSISGPILCDYDQCVFDACVKLWHEKCSTGIVLETSLSEIWKAMGNKSVIGKKNRISLRRCLSRLHKVSIEVKSTDKNNKSFWGGGIIDNVIYCDAKESRLTVTFNLYMVACYLQGAYATLNHDIYKILSSYGKKIYLFLMSHENPERTISLEKLRPLMGVNKEISNESFMKYFNNALKELKANNILDENSKVRNGILYSKILHESWKTKPEILNSLDIIMHQP